MTFGGAIGVPTDPPAVPTAPGDAGKTGAAGFGTPAGGGGANGAAAAAAGAATDGPAPGPAAAGAAEAVAGAPDVGAAWPAGTDDPGVADAGLPWTGDEETVDSIGGRNAADDAADALVLANDAGAAKLEDAAGSEVDGCPCPAPAGIATPCGLAAAPAPPEAGDPPPAPDDELNTAPLVDGLVVAAPADDGAEPLPTPADVDDEGRDGAADTEDDGALGAETDGACATALPTLDEPTVVGVGVDPGTELPVGAVGVCVVGMGEGVGDGATFAVGTNSCCPKLAGANSAPPPPTTGVVSPGRTGTKPPGCITAGGEAGVDAKLKVRDFRASGIGGDGT